VTVKAPTKGASTSSAVARPPVAGPARPPAAASSIPSSSAIDLTEGTRETPRKRSRADDVETRVAKARSLCVSEVDARAHELMEEPFRDFLAKKIDGAEIERRREAAREQAAKEHPTLSALDKAFAAYTAAAAAEQAAAAKREAAEAKLEAALCALEIKGEAGSQA